MMQSPPPGPLSHVSLSGVAVRVEYVRLLAGRLGGDEVAQKLERAVANGNVIVALSLEDRQRILGVLEEPPMAFREQPWYTLEAVPGRIATDPLGLR